MAGPHDNGAVYFLDRRAVLQLVVLVTWGVALLLTYFTGHYVNYLKPSFAKLLLVGAALAVVMATVRATTLMQLHVHDDDCRKLGFHCSYKHRARLAHIEAVVLFVLPLIILVSVRSAGLGTFAAVKRGMVTGSDAAAIGAAPLEQVLAQKALSEEYPEVSIASAAKAGPAADGRKLTVVGMFYRPQGIDETHFYLLRFAINCCAADAQAVVLPVAAAERALFENDQWVRCRGVLGIQTFDEKTLAVLRAEAVIETESPLNPYLE